MKLFLANIHFHQVGRCGDFHRGFTSLEAVDYKIATAAPMTHNNCMIMFTIGRVCTSTNTQLCFKFQHSKQHVIIIDVELKLYFYIHYSIYLNKKNNLIFGVYFF